MSYWGEVEIIESAITNAHIQGNYSTVTINYYACSSSYAGWSGYATYPYLGIYYGSQSEEKSVTLSGFDFRSSLKILIGSITKNIPHNSDGTMSVSASFTWNSNHSLVGTLTGSGSKELTKIPRASVPTITGTLELGSTLTIKTNRASSNFTHEFYYYWNNDISHKYFNGQIGDSVTWTIPKDLANYIPSGTSGTLTIECTTYDGVYGSGTWVGTDKQSFKVDVPDTTEFKPSISTIALSEAVSGIATKFGAYIQNQSKISGTVTAAGVYSSTIKSYKIVINGTTYTSSTFTTDVLKLAGTNTAAVTVTDTRGREATKNTTFEVLAYEGPTITNMTAHRCLQNGTLDDEGEYVKIDITATVPSLNSKNTYSYTFQYRDTDEDDYTAYSVTLTATTTDGITTLTGSFIMAADGDNSFEYLFSVTDYFLPASKTRSIETVFQLINFGASGKCMAFGKVAEIEDAFECGMDMYYKGCELVDLVYPVGSIYLSVKNTNPSTYLGGTWVAWGAGRVPVGVNASDTNFATVEKTGGASTHTHTQGATGAATGNTGSTALTIDQIPSHSHSFTAVQRVSTSESVASGAYGYVSQTLNTGNTGGGAGHTHTLNSHTHTNPTTDSSSSLQPYITCYMWKRTA